VVAKRSLFLVFLSGNSEWAAFVLPLNLATASVASSDFLRSGLVPRKLSSRGSQGAAIGSLGSSLGPVRPLQGRAYGRVLLCHPVLPAPAAQNEPVAV
jgi:hypothetical protein